MRVSDLNLHELLDLGSQEGVIRFGGERALILDAVALGLLRKELIDNLGMSAARGLLTRFGFSHGWRTALSLRDSYPWDSEREWQRAGSRLHSLQGLVRVEGLPGQPPGPFGAALWFQSYEAEQHLLHLGQAHEPVCWTLTGFASGYMSAAHGRSVLCLESQCLGRGDARCQLEAKPHEDWDESVLAEALPFYEMRCLESSLEALTAALKQADQRLEAKRSRLAKLDPQAKPGALLARSEAMRRCVDLAQRAARVDTTVLITGESGAGKERMARLIHDQSPRAGRAFLAVNCGAIADSLIESELFGHARGAFSGASQDRVGLFEAAQGGTLFLDELGELPTNTQVKLLRVLQERELRRVGENRSRPIDVRVVTATNRELQKDVQEGRFRRDLYYRVKVIEIKLPALRERREDILPLARELLFGIAERLDLPARRFSPLVADALVAYPWPGNVRELQNALERAAVVAAGERLELEDLPEEIREPQRLSSRPTSSGQTLAEIERQAIAEAFEANQGHRAKTAAQLGIGSATLYRKLKKYGLGSL